MNVTVLVEPGVYEPLTYSDDAVEFFRNCLRCADKLDRIPGLSIKIACSKRFNLYADLKWRNGEPLIIYWDQRSKEISVHNPSDPDSRSKRSSWDEIWQKDIFPHIQRAIRKEDAKLVKEGNKLTRLIDATIGLQDKKFNKVASERTIRINSKW